MGSTDDFQVLRESITGRRKVDEQTFTSLAVLEERLRRIKRLGGAFSRVDFSRVVKKMCAQKQPMTVS